MRPLDWLVLLGTLAVIVAVGAWKERGKKTAEEYLRGGRTLAWWTIGLSVMATQASAITFLSLPGQAYEDGLGFVQFYFGLPVAMVLLSAFLLPVFYRLKVYTAYEYLERRFDRKTRQLVALLFLLSRGLAAGVSILAPAIVLSAVLGWPLRLTSALIGGVVIVYTVSGGTRIVSRTQTYQMVVMLGGMLAAGVVLFRQLPPEVSWQEAGHLAGALGKMKAVDLSVRLDTRYTLWSGLLGGLFVQLAYFGTDQSQVQRYLGGASLAESRLGLLFNGLVKIPMQLLILGVGVLLVLFHQFEKPPVYFEEAAWRRTLASPRGAEARALEADFERAFEVRRDRAKALVQALEAPADPARVTAAKEALASAQAGTEAVRKRAKALVVATQPGVDGKDADYIFVGYVVRHFPPGLVGLLVAVILSAAMSAVAAALSSLGTTSVVDFWRPWFAGGVEHPRDVLVARLATVAFGVLAVLFAVFAAQLDNLIQAVNILGSIFYGPMLGVFLVGILLGHVHGTAAFVATLVAQAAVVVVFATTSVGFLWYNVIGCGAVVVVALVAQGLLRAEPQH